MTEEARGPGGQTPEGGAPLTGEFPYYFDDPVKDALVNVILELAGQVWIGRERQMALEDVLIGSGVIGPEAVESYEPDTGRSQAIRAARNAFVADIFEEFRRIGSMEKGSG